MISVPDDEVFESEVVPNNDPVVLTEAFIGVVGNYTLTVWANGAVWLTKKKFGSESTVTTTLEKIWDEAL